MDSAEVRIKAIIAAHLELAEAYEKIMMDIENKEKLISLFKEKAAEPDVLDRRGIAYHVIDRISTFWVPTPSTRGLLGRFIFKPFVKYFLSAHIRRQYQKLYSLYLAEILLQIGSSRNKEDVVELRKIASDIKDYSETLPTLKSLTALLATVLTTTATLLGIFNYFVPIQTILPKDPIFIFFFGGFILFVVMIAVIPMTRAFVFKRLLFKNKQSQELHPFFFEEKKAKKLYNSSVYEVEDKLFESLGNREKPKEIPIDVILNITAYASGLAVSFIYWVLVVFFEPLEPFNNPFSILYLIVFPAISSFAIVANISHYKNRVKARLV